MVKKKTLWYENLRDKMVMGIIITFGVFFIVLVLIIYISMGIEVFKGERYCSAKGYDGYVGSKSSCYNDLPQVCIENAAGIKNCASYPNREYFPIPIKQ